MIKAEWEQFQEQLELERKLSASSSEELVVNWDVWLAQQAIQPARTDALYAMEKLGVGQKTIQDFLHQR